MYIDIIASSIQKWYLCLLSKIAREEFLIYFINNEYRDTQTYILEHQNFIVSLLLLFCLQLVPLFSLAS